MTIKELLAAADPIPLEAAPALELRNVIRRTVVSAASASARQKRGLSRRFVVLAGGLAAVLAALVTSPDWMGSDTTLHAAMQFEVRLAASDAKPGVRVAVDPGSGRTIYLDQDVVLTNREITETRVVTLPSGFGVEVRLTDGGAAKLRAVTADNLGRLLAIVVDGKVLAAPTVRSPIAEIGVIKGKFTREEAERLAAGIRTP
jgi:preprotein translocase subunit SecD